MKFEITAKLQFSPFFSLFLSWDVIVHRSNEILVYLLLPTSSISSSTLSFHSQLETFSLQSFLVLNTYLQKIQLFILVNSNRRVLNTLTIKQGVQYQFYSKPIDTENSDNYWLSTGKSYCKAMKVIWLYKLNGNKN